MNINIIRNDNLNAAELNQLLATNKWDVNPIEKLDRCLETAWGNVCARNEDGSLIGYVRVISDGIRHAYICSMIVHPDYRGKGVGTQVMDEVMNMLKEINLYPTLVANPGNKSFYEKHGFRTEIKGFTAMCIR